MSAERFAQLVFADTHEITAMQTDASPSAQPQPQPQSQTQPRLVNSKHCRTPFFVPSNYDKDMAVRSATLPQYECVRSHMFGANPKLYSGNAVHMMTRRADQKPLLVFATSATVILHDAAICSQTFFDAHTDDIISLTISKDYSLAASGQVGKDAVLLVWDPQAIAARRFGVNSTVGDANSSAMAIVLTIGGKKGVSPGFFQRGVSAVEISFDSRFVCGIACDDHHRMGIWDIASGQMRADVVCQNGTPPQIYALHWAPAMQETEFISRDHVGLCDVLVTVGTSS